MFIVDSAGPVEIRTHVAGGPRRFRTGLKADAAGKSGANQDRLTKTFGRIKLHHALVNIHFGDTCPIDFHVKAGTAEVNRTGITEVDVHEGVVQLDSVIPVLLTSTSKLVPRTEINRT